MNSPIWNKIKNDVYYLDGSLRDIYILNTTQRDWENWIDLINNKYSVSFYNGITDETEHRINKEIIFTSWAKGMISGSNATIRLAGIIVKCYFFAEEEIENDIQPNEIVDLDHHRILIEYLVDVSTLLGKQIRLTAENDKDDTYIIVEGNVVTYSRSLE